MVYVPYNGEPQMLTKELERIVRQNVGASQWARDVPLEKLFGNKRLELVSVLAQCRMCIGPACNVPFENGELMKSVTYDQLSNFVHATAEHASPEEPTPPRRAA